MLDCELAGESAEERYAVAFLESVRPLLRASRGAEIENTILRLTKSLVRKVIEAEHHADSRAAHRSAVENWIDALRAEDAATVALEQARLAPPMSLRDVIDAEGGVLRGISRTTYPALKANVKAAPPRITEEMMARAVGLCPVCWSVSGHASGCVDSAVPFADTVHGTSRAADPKLSGKVPPAIRSWDQLSAALGQSMAVIRDRACYGCENDQNDLHRSDCPAAKGISVAIDGEAAALMSCQTCGPRPWKTAPPLDSRDKNCPNCGRTDLVKA